MAKNAGPAFGAKAPPSATLTAGASTAATPVAAVPVAAVAPTLPDRPSPDPSRESAMAHKGPKATRSIKPAASAQIALPPGLSAADAARTLAEGKQELSLGHYDEARKKFGLLLDANRERAPALLALANIAFQQERWADCARKAKEAASAGAGIAAQALLGEAFFRLGNFPEAVRAYEKALEIDPDHAGAQRGLDRAKRALN